MASIHLLFLYLENILDVFFSMLSQKRLVESSLKTTTVIPTTGSNKLLYTLKCSFHVWVTWLGWCSRTDKFKIRICDYKLYISRSPYFLRGPIKGCDCIYKCPCDKAYVDFLHHLVVQTGFKQKYRPALVQLSSISSTQYAGFFFFQI